MPRRRKLGLEFFPHDLDLSQDPKIKYIEATFGLAGYAIFVKMLEKIYRDGYCLPWDSERDTVILGKEFGLDGEQLARIIDGCVHEGLFNKRLYEEQKVLTSAAIQRRFLAVKGRGYRLIKPDLCLVTEDGVSTDNEESTTYGDESKNTAPQREEKEKEKEMKGEDNWNVDSFEYKAAKYFYDRLKTSYPNYTQYTFESVRLEWCDVLDKLQRIDHYTQSDIRKVIHYVRDVDDFWGKNIRSINKLRLEDRQHTKYFALMLDRAAEVKPRSNTTPKTDPSKGDLARVLAKMKEAKNDPAGKT